MATSFSGCGWVLFLVLCSLPSERTEGADYYHTIQISSLLPASVCEHSTKGAKTKESLTVVHRHGPCSDIGLGQDNANVPTQILTHDQSRVNSIHSVVAIKSGRKSLPDSKAVIPAKSGSSLGSGNYIVTVGLGTPKRDLTLVFDTGSDLTWTQCEPCVRYCYKQQQPFFDPVQSTTYANITCNSALCSQLNSATGNSPGCSSSTCVYAIQYGDQSFTIGYFAKEKLTLTSTDTFDNFLFGCGENNRGLFGTTAGLLGLGRNKLSVVSQTSQKYGQYFSYCLPPSPAKTGHLTFGDSGASKRVMYTPFADTRGTSFYYFDITGINVGGRQLSISASVFKTAGTIIDSGTVITRLPPAAYSSLRDAFRQLMTKYPSTKGVAILDTCYDFSNYTAVTIPTISILLNGNVKVDLDPSGILYVITLSQTCLAFAGNRDATDTAILGNVQQRTLEVVYDVVGGKLGFGPGGCP